MKLQDYIKVIPSILGHRSCLDIINNKEYKYIQSKVGGIGIKRNEDSKIRNCSYTYLSPEDDKICHQAVGKAINKYIEELQPNNPLPFKFNDSGYELLKYKKGGFFIQHVDDYKSISRRVSISLLINEEYEGGEMQFFGDYKVSGGIGSAIIFPSNFCYPHEVLPVKSGTRYSLVTWIF